MKQPIKAASISAMTLIAVIGIGSAFYTYKSAPVAEASQLAGKSLVAYSSASGDQQASAKDQFGADPIKYLEEAKSAKDLRIITKAEFDAEVGRSAGGTITAAGGSTAASGSASMGSTDGSSAVDSDPGGGAVLKFNGQSATKYMRYTAPSGSIVILGLDASNMPIYKVELSK
jgi:hypothetical protein